MNDLINIKKIWEDIDFMQILVECQSPYIKIKKKYYVGNESIRDLMNGINLFLFARKESFSWQNGEKGGNSNACFSLEFTYKDRCGHIMIDVFMELDDGGTYKKHNCCFLLETEYGQLANFSNGLNKILDGDIGASVILGK